MNQGPPRILPLMVLVGGIAWFIVNAMNGNWYRIAGVSAFIVTMAALAYVASVY